MRVICCALVLSAFVGCGSDDLEPAPWHVGDLPDEEDNAPGETGECVADAECGEDAYCHRPSTCGAANYCEDGYPPYSAAPPDTACGCDGTVTSVGAGYPGPHAWQTGFLGGYEVQGQPCDPTATPPFTYRIRYTLTDLPVSPATWARLNEQLDTDEPIKRVEEGEVSFEATADQWASFSLDVLVDANGDGECDPEDDTVYVAYGDMQQADLETFEIEIEPSVQESPESCDRW